MVSRRKIIFEGKKIISDTLVDRNWDYVRHHRNKWLKSTDKYMQMSDRFSEETMAEILAYRQTLRDLPQTYESANDACDNFPAPLKID